MQKHVSDVDDTMQDLYQADVSLNIEKVKNALLPRVTIHFTKKQL